MPQCEVLEKISEQLKCPGVIPPKSYRMIDGVTFNGVPVGVPTYDDVHGCWWVKVHAVDYGETHTYRVDAIDLIS